jgi:hypothetical protein
MHSRPGRRTKDSGRRIWLDHMIANVTLRIVGTVVLFFLSFAAARWLPDLMAGMVRLATGTAERRASETWDGSRFIDDACEHGERALIAQSFLWIEHEAPLTGRQRVAGCRVLGTPRLSRGGLLEVKESDAERPTAWLGM